MITYTDVTETQYGVLTVQNQTSGHTLINCSKLINVLPLLTATVRAQKSWEQKIKERPLYCVSTFLLFVSLPAAHSDGGTLGKSFISPLSSFNVPRGDRSGDVTNGESHEGKTSLVVFCAGNMMTHLPCTSTIATCCYGDVRKSWEQNKKRKYTAFVYNLILWVLAAHIDGGIY